MFTGTHCNSFTENVLLKSFAYLQQRENNPVTKYKVTSRDLHSQKAFVSLSHLFIYLPSISFVPSLSLKYSYANRQIIQLCPLRPSTKSFWPAGWLAVDEAETQEKEVLPAHCYIAHRCVGWFHTDSGSVMSDKNIRSPTASFCCSLSFLFIR